MGFTNVLALTRGHERYVFLYDDDPESQRTALHKMGEFAQDKELAFSWYDVAMLAQRLRKVHQGNAS